MNKQDLAVIVGKKVGALDREQKIALDVFIQKVSDNIKVNETIQIPEIGIFQLKKNEKKNSSKFSKEITGSNYQLLYAPLSYRKGTFDVIPFDVIPNFKKDPEFIDDVFSISLGKPLIPLIGTKRKELFIQSSYILLKKRFGEKIEQILEQTVLLKDFKIEYNTFHIQNDFIENALEEEEKSNELENIAPSSIPWDFGFPASEVSDEKIIEHPEIKNDETEKNLQNDNTNIIKEKKNDLNNPLGFPIGVYIEPDNGTDKINYASYHPLQKKNIGNKEIDQDDKGKSSNRINESISGIELKNEENDSIEKPVDVYKPIVDISRYKNIIDREDKKYKILLWFAIIFIIFSLGGGLYYYFYIYNAQIGDESSNNLARKNHRSDFIKDSLVNKKSNNLLNDSIMSNSKSISDEEIFRVDGKNKMVKEYLYTDGKKYTIQISSWKTRSIAEKEVARLRKTGLDAYILIINPNSSSPLYCVRYGDFPTINEAEQFLKKPK